MSRLHFFCIALTTIVVAGCAHTPNTQYGDFNHALMAKHKERLGGVMPEPTGRGHARQGGRVSGGGVPEDRLSALENQVAQHDQAIGELQEGQSRLEQALGEYGGGEVVYFRVGWFDFGKTYLNTGAKKQLSDLASQVRTGKITILSIEGYADLRGTQEANRAISLARARAGKNFLAEQGVAVAGVTVKSMNTTQSYGSYKNNRCLMIAARINEQSDKGQ